MSRVLVACEFSGIVRDAFIERGHDAWSCDLLPSERPGPHIERDIIRTVATKKSRRHLNRLSTYNVQYWDIGWDWDMMIAFPPCTHLAVSGARWFKGKQVEQAEAVAFFMALANADIPKIAIENPIGIMSTRWRKPDQIIQPWQFGHGETKATCLWLKGLRKLTPTNIVEGRTARVHKEPPSADRWKNRSRTYAGIAEAMAEQWSHPIEESVSV